MAKMAYSYFGRGVEFFPNVEPEIAAIQVQGRGNLSIADKDDLVRLVEATLLLKELKSVYTRTGSVIGGSADVPSEDVIGTITVEFIDWQKRRPAEQILDEIERNTKDIPEFVSMSKSKRMDPLIKSR